MFNVYLLQVNLPSLNEFIAIENATITKTNNEPNTLNNDFVGVFIYNT